MALPRRKNNQKESGKKIKSEFENRVLDVARVTRVVAGGKRMRFRACVIVGNKNGKVGMGVKKGLDVSDAVSKATRTAERSAIFVSMEKGTIPHEIYEKFGAAKIILKPASRGSGIIAGGSIRTVLELAGIQNVASKMLGSNNKINNAQAAIRALSRLRSKDKTKALRSLNK